MTSDHSGSNFWTSIPGLVAGLTGLLTAVAGVVVALAQIGVIGGGDTTSDLSQPLPAPASTSSVAVTSASVDSGGAAALLGTWRGSVTSSDGPFDVELRITSPCRVREPCGTIAVSSAPCDGRVSLWRVKGDTFTMYVDDFTAGSSSDCSPGAGEYFELVDAQHLQYSTGYSDAAGVLTRS